MEVMRYSGVNFSGAKFSPLGEFIFIVITISIIGLFIYGIYKSSKW